jgi:integrase
VEFLQKHASRYDESGLSRLLLEISLLESAYHNGGNPDTDVLLSAAKRYYNQPGDFVFPSERLKGKKPLDLASVLKKKIQPAFKRIGITGVGWHTFRHTVGTMLAEMGEHQLMIRDYLRHSDLHVTNKYLQATTKSKRLAQGKLVDAILPGGVLSGSKSTLVN